MKIHEIEEVISTLHRRQGNYEEELNTVSSEIDEINNKINGRRNKFAFLQIFFLILGFFLSSLLLVSLILFVYNISSTENRINNLKQSEIVKKKEQLEDKIAKIQNEIVAFRTKKKKIIDDLTFETYVAGTSFRQKEIKKIVKHLENNYSIFPNETYTLSKRDLIDFGYEEEMIWEFDPIAIDLELIPEPDNKHDENAIAVCYKFDDSILKLGYILKKENKKVRNMQIDKVTGIIKGGRYKLLKFVDYDDFTDKEYFNLIRDSKNYKIDLQILEQE